MKLEIMFNIIVMTYRNNKQKARHYYITQKYNLLYIPASAAKEVTQHYPHIK